MLEWLWRRWVWINSLPYFVWWVLFLIFFLYVGLRTFFFERKNQEGKIRTVSGEKSAAWLQRWLISIRQSAGSPFIRDAMMSYRLLAVQVLAQRENLTPREFSRQLSQGERMLPEEVSSLLITLEKIDEQRAVQGLNLFQKTLLRLRSLIEGHNQFVLAGMPETSEQVNLPELKKSARVKIEQLIIFLEREMEIRNDDDNR